MAPPCGERCFQQPWKLSWSPLTGHKSKTPHRPLYSVWQFLLNKKAFNDPMRISYQHLRGVGGGCRQTKHRYSPDVFSSEPNTCLIWIFSLASCLTGSLVEETEDEDEVWAFWTEEDPIWAPVAEYMSDMPAEWKNPYSLSKTSCYYFQMFHESRGLCSSLCIVSF